MCPGGQEIETFAHLHTLSWRTCLQSHEQNPGVEARRAGMKGCFVFPHKEMKKANKGFNFFYGSLCWASPVSMCPAQTDPLEMGIHPWGKKTFQGEGLRLPSLFSLGRGSLGHLVSSLLVAFRSVLPSLFSIQRKSSRKGISHTSRCVGLSVQTSRSWL